MAKKTAARLKRDISYALHSRKTHKSGNPRRWSGSEVQSLLFSRSHWSPSAALEWARDHDYRATKVHVTDDYVRIRQFAPVRGTQKRTIVFGDGIKAIVEQKV